MQVEMQNPVLTKVEMKVLVMVMMLFLSKMLVFEVNIHLKIPWFQIETRI